MSKTLKELIGDELNKAILLGVEFGYKGCEKGRSIEQVLADARSSMDVKSR